MNPLHFRLLAILALLSLTHCGPVKGRVHPTVNTQLNTGQSNSRTNQSDRFIFNEEQKKCLNSKGSEGLNMNEAGPCGFIYNAKIKLEGKDLDFRGSVFIGVQFQSGTSFENSILDHASFIECSGKEISFEKASLTDTKFKDCSFVSNS